MILWIDQMKSISHSFKESKKKSIPINKRIILNLSFCSTSIISFRTNKLKFTEYFSIF